MRIVIFCHTLISDWNHGNAHFLRGVSRELLSRGHEVDVYEPSDSWSYRNLVEGHGDGPIQQFYEAYPQLSGRQYLLNELDIDSVLDGAELVLVHEWNDPELVRRVGEHRSRNRGYTLLFHDTHHRSVTRPEEMSRYDLEHYDGVLVFGRSIAEKYRKHGWAHRVWVWHEAADTSVFKPLEADRERDLVWVGNWGDDERSAELREFLIDPVAALQLKATVHGVRYPEDTLAALKDAGIGYGGWVPNFAVPALFSTARVTVHVPRRPYATALPGIPTIRIFEALACGIPLVSAPWEDSEGLFREGEDFLYARTGDEMKHHLHAVLSDADLATSLARNGLETIHARHTCAHRVDELMQICTAMNRNPLLTAEGVV